MSYSSPYKDMSSEPPLTIPFLPHVTIDRSLPVTPVRIAAWRVSTTRGPARRVALAGNDNTIWIVTSQKTPTRNLASPLSLAIPATSPMSTRTASQGASPYPYPRPRAMSNASSVISCSSRAGKRMFSPTSSNTTLVPTPALSTVAASPEPPHSGQRQSATRSDLLHTLKSQAEDDRTGLGLGLAGLTRRGLNVHSKEDLDSTTPKDAVSAGLPSEGVSDIGHSRTRTLSRFSGFWTTPKGQEDPHAPGIDERAVEKEMAREEAEDAREAEELETVQRAQSSTPLATPTPSPTLESPAAPIRIILPNPSHGHIIHIAVFEGAGYLTALRDVGLLDVISLNDLGLTHHVNLNAVDTATADYRVARLAAAWAWRGVHLAECEEGAVLVINGTPWPTIGPSPNGEVTRVIFLDILNLECVSTLELPGIGDVGVSVSGEACYLLHATITSLMSYHINFPTSNGAVQQPSHSSSTTPLLSTPPIRTSEGPKHEFGLAKFLTTRRNVSRKVETIGHQSQQGVDGGIECQRDGGGHWSAIYLHNDGYGIGITENHVEPFHFDGTRLSVRGSIPIEGTVCDVAFSPGWQDICLVTNGGTIIFGVEDRDAARQTWHPRKIYPAHAVHLVGRCLDAVEDNVVTTVDLGSVEHCVTAILEVPVTGDQVYPLGTDLIFVADKAGNMRKQTLGEYFHQAAPEPVLAADRLDSPVTCLAIVPSQFAIGGQYLIAGDGDGTLRIWDAKPLRLCGSWAVFDDPVHSATLLEIGQAPQLRDCVLLTSSKGSVAVVCLKEMEELFLLPAARAPLTQIFIGEGDIMLAFDNGKARVWNVKTREFRRSTGFDSAEDMLNSGEWTEVPFRAIRVDDSPVSMATGPSNASNLGRLLQLDLRQLGRWLREPGGASPLPALRGLLSAFLTFGINRDIDQVCEVHLGIVRPTIPVLLGMPEPHTAVQITYAPPASAWRISPELTGLRQLAIVFLLRPFLDSPDHESYAADVIAYYTTCLPDDTLEADLELFAALYLDSVSDVHLAARMLFAARLARMSNERVAQLVTDQQSFLPALVPPDQQMSDTSARSLTMVGGMAIHRFECMNPSALKAVADSISLYLHDSSIMHVALAIELCSKGFSTWQTYIDPMDLLRRLFYLATHNGVIGANIAALARLAVLQVASSNAPLFMSTLSMEILDAQSVEGRTAIMKLCVFMARKRPALLENGLARICEAVVKSLDPNAGKMREDVWEAATVILNELVQAFTTIDFHSGTQKLAVGTNEGAVIMYDLKSASRLYVLEPHSGSVSAVAFSPDGRRLVTVSLHDSNVTVWKVGSSLSGFFNVGGPPRQGAARGEPYKRIPFVRPHKDPDEDAGALSDAVIQWRGNRQALVTIKETTLNFETT